MKVTKKSGFGLDLRPTFDATYTLLMYLHMIHSSSLYEQSVGSIICSLVYDLHAPMF